MEVFPGITMDPGIRFGKLCLTGTRMDVATIVSTLSAGETIEAIQEAYALSREQVLTALRYTARMSQHIFLQQWNMFLEYSAGRKFSASFLSSIAGLGVYC